MTMLANAANHLHQLESKTRTATTGLIATSETLRNDLEGEYAQAARAVITDTLDQVAQPLNRASARALMDPILRQTAVAIGYSNPEGRIADIVRALYDYMVDNSQTINQFENTWDTSWSAGGGNTGDASVLRVTVDENAYPLDGFRPGQNWNLECTADARKTGLKFRENWLLESTSAGRTDNLDTTGGALYSFEGLRTLTAADSLVSNAYFSNYTLDGSSQLTSLGGVWTQNTGANLYTNLSINTTYYVPTPGDTALASLQFNGDETIYQDLVTDASVRFIDAPYEVSVRIAKVGTPTGTFTLRLSGTIGSGGQSATLAHTGMTGSGTFDVLRLTLGQNSWFANWNANDLKIQIALASSGSIDASNYFVVDSVVLSPLTRVGQRGDPNVGRGGMGQYMAVFPGVTASVEGDVYTATDAYGTRGSLAWAFSVLAEYGYLPSTTGGTETVSDI